MKSRNLMFLALLTPLAMPGNAAPVVSYSSDVVAQPYGGIAGIAQETKTEKNGGKSANETKKAAADKAAKEKKTDKKKK